MTDYKAARNDAIAFLTALHAKSPEDAALIFEEAADTGLLVYVLGLMTLGVLDGVEALGGMCVGDALRSMGLANAELA